MELDNQGTSLATLKIRPILVERVKEAQTQETRMCKVIEEVKSRS